ncbi:MAG: hypothetical protein K9J16_10820 [Melioribacteraceae bacterium]|nr:hypothetical protein [Melioribacteraceae bacterium]MCF8355500.1 hypothetical protein [Melioribacteraceae bacterium]MCF8394188.1 hypothetical protein [Melioribacteraceae bacterium]MCF8419908.1 hypothetical protein [Melioribacteraceae bacterium]
MSTKLIFAAIIIIAGICIISFFIWHYGFSIYEVRSKVDYSRFKDDSIVLIKVFPVNSFGSRIPLRNIEADFDIISGSESIDKIEKISGNELLIKILNQFGEVKISIDSQYSLAPQIISINIDNAVHFN